MRKTLFLSLVLLIALSGACQYYSGLWSNYPDTARRFYFDGIKLYKVLYCYDHRNYFTPAVDRMSYDSVHREWIEEEDDARDNHYPAKVFVYLRGRKKYTLVADPIMGTYVPGGCFEDVVKHWVQSAKQRRIINQSPNQ